MFDLTRLRMLRELAHRGTMTAAAEALGMTSSAVSQQLAILEHEARVPLLQRVGRRVRLTPDGERLLVHAKAILEAAESAVLDMRAGDETPRGALEVATFPSFAKARLLPAATRVQARWPEMRVVIRELEPIDAIEAVRDGRCQVAMSFTYNLVPRSDVSGLVFHHVMEEPVMLALPRTTSTRRSPVRLASLAKARWIIGSRQTDDRLLAERACAVAGFAPDLAHTIDDYDLLLQMVGEGFGIGFVPMLALRAPSAATVVAGPPADVAVSRRIEAVTRAIGGESPAIRALLAELKRGA